MEFTIPLVLGSLWGLIPSGLVAAVLVVRAGLEDRVLRRELEGYADYASRVRDRLIPGVW
jgi:protein-S-isoprenylcysteine O-methyltransferase Ste14